MTRGQKACFVYFVDDETRDYFQGRMGPAATEIVPFSNSLPLLDLRVAADGSYRDLGGYFSNSENVKWHRIAGGPFSKDRFLVRVEGDSMEPLIKDGQLCIFRKDP